MLKHEQTVSQTDPSAAPTVSSSVPNAADARVTPDELNAALKALEDRQSSTVAIGSVVDELRLNATPEQIWEQVQQQRAQKQVPKPGATVIPNAPARRRMRTWRDIKGWVWVLFWCGGGLGLISGGLHMVHSPVASGQTVTISGDSRTETLLVQGKDVVISGDDDKITLQGKAQSITVVGDDDAIIADTADTALVSGDGDTMKWTGTPPPDLSDPSHRQHFSAKGTP